MVWVSAMLGVAFSSSAMAAPTIEELWQRLQEQEKEIERLKKEQNVTDKKVEATVDAIEQGSIATGGKALEWASKTKIGGYGEHHYNNFDGKDDQVDAHRYVLYVSHEYNENVRFFSEVELEHSLAGEGKPGEVELEQAYIEWDYAENHALVAGQFLVPVGILNETHEPDTFYGTERNLIEKNIIPTTWWESGVMFRGEFAPGLSYNFAIHSGLENDEANIRSGRQKSAEATANDLAYTGRVKYTGVPGLELSATLQYQEDISQGQFNEASAVLSELHAIYNVGSFGLRALWASWNVDGDEAELTGRDEQEGFYIEPSYKITDRLGVFVRYNEWNNVAGLDGSDAQEVLDYGINFWLVPNVVFKADISDHDDDNVADSFNLGVGWSF